MIQLDPRIRAGNVLGEMRGRYVLPTTSRGSGFDEIPLLIQIGTGVVCVTVFGGLLEVVGGEGEVGVGAEAVEALA